MKVRITDIHKSSAWHWNPTKGCGVGDIIELVDSKESSRIGYMQANFISPNVTGQVNFINGFKRYVIMTRSNQCYQRRYMTETYMQP